MNQHLILKNLSVAVGTVEILKTVNLAIPPNKVLAVIGPSGCGKTTLLRTINRLIEEESQAKVSGEILFKGKPIQQIPLAKLRKDIGLVFQQPLPFPMSIYNNLAYALKYHGVKGKSSLAEIIEATLKLCGLYEEVKDHLTMSALKLSGGQQQRLCIARSLCVEPEVLLMDEPCSSLDIHNTKLIEDLILKLSAHYTIVIVTHNLQQARRIADYTAFFLEGRLIEMNTTKEFFTNPQAEASKQYLEGLFG
ncbi:ABC-type phosphate transport system, ATPase component [Desulfosporosinus orientis DSM 765]|uniref:ABC-type phosphate transport system, ATPase component n=1 Tax=Desulfosporosinus orientis (strain ATCC 19365 / DSM 765 / NCIMB 8382 / VKM B-1628 / Singapore I) TaxID=768706 RepID=G7W672_DESOD|nr:phosphate ABC transporter ATP-binding protein [Desulfosporosinus orientis]AET67734.1 ABC-type phosphate transport system, ATPase component [Desulfosporosinus orientis DSM 765]